MILIYCDKETNRLQYITQFIFKELLNSAFLLTTNKQEFIHFEGVKINYSQSIFTETSFTIKPVNLLFQQGVSTQIITCFEVNNNKAFFKVTDSDFCFDIFAASFYLLSRYEEYLPHTKDIYGRYAHQNSIAFKEGFLHQPLINIWVINFAKALLQTFPFFFYNKKQFKFQPTYDIDIAYSYKHKGIVKTAGGFLKNSSFKRLKVLSGFSNDPFDVYEELFVLHQKYNLKPIYFFLMAAKNGRYDKNILPANKSMRQLIVDHAKKYIPGIHPSWQSGDNFQLLLNEKNQLESMVERSVIRSRQHYIRFNLPEGLQHLLNAGIQHDYSMGYGSINGFRASVANSFYWFNLQTDEVTGLKIHPFCFMDANSFYEQKFTAGQAFDELMSYHSICKNVGGTLITIWHNHLLGTHRMYAGWGKTYFNFLDKIAE